MLKKKKKADLTPIREKQIKITMYKFLSFKSAISQETDNTLCGQTGELCFPTS